MLSRLDSERRESVCFGANLVRGNGADGVHQPCVVPEAVNFLPGGGDSELAVVLDKGRTAQVKGTQAVSDNVSFKNGASIAKKCFTHTLAIGQVRRGKRLESLGVADRDEVLFADIRKDGDVGRKVEVNWKRDELVERK